MTVYDRYFLIIAFIIFNWIKLLPKIKILVHLSNEMLCSSSFRALDSWADGHTIRSHSGHTTILLLTIVNMLQNVMNLLSLGCSIVFIMLGSSCYLSAHSVLNILDIASEMPTIALFVIAVVQAVGSFYAYFIGTLLSVCMRYFISHVRHVVLHSTESCCNKSCVFFGTR